MGTFSDASTAWQITRSRVLGISHSDPHHERITYEALDSVFPDKRIDQSSIWYSGLPKLSTGNHYDGCPTAFAQEVLRGIYWNDDPTALLFDDGWWTWAPLNGFCDAQSWWLSSGVMFVWVYKRHCHWEMHEWEWPDAMLCHTHHGQFMFIHAMDFGGRAAAHTLGKMLEWTKLMWRLAVEETDAATFESETLAHCPILRESMATDVKPTNLNPLRGKKMSEVMLLGNYGGKLEVHNPDPAKRAVGSIAHMIEDSYAAGHCMRRYGTGDILGFGDYSTQDVDTSRWDPWTCAKDVCNTDVHGTHDKPDQPFDLQRRNYARDTVTTLFNHWKNATPTHTAMNWFETGPFKLDAAGAASASSIQVLVEFYFTTVRCCVDWWYEDNCNCGSWLDWKAADIRLCFVEGECMHWINMDVDDWWTPRDFFHNGPYTTSANTHRIADMGCVQHMEIKIPDGDTWELDWARVNYLSNSNICSSPNPSTYFNGRHMSGYYTFHVSKIGWQPATRYQRRRRRRRRRRVVWYNPVTWWR